MLASPEKKNESNQLPAGFLVDLATNNILLKDESGKLPDSNLVSIKSNAN